MNLVQIKQLAAEQMAERSSHKWKETGNKYYHGERTAKLAITLRNLIIPDDSSHDEILTVAAWFHDIANGKENHDILGAQLTRNLLAGHCSENELDDICEIIEKHDIRGPEKESFSMYVQIHQDADFLDHFGTFEIWSAFIYAVPHRETIEDRIDWLLNKRPADNNRYRTEMNFDISRKIFEEKIEFLTNFSKRFAVEGTGGIWELDKFFV